MSRIANGGIALITPLSNRFARHKITKAIRRFAGQTNNCFHRSMVRALLQFKDLTIRVILNQDYAPSLNLS